MIDNLDITKVLFLDIETVSGEKSYEDLSDTFKDLWAIKCKSILRQYDEPIPEEQVIALYPEKAGIFAEFGKIVCISVGLVYRDATTRELGVRLKSFASDDEAELLKDFSKLVEQYYNNINTHYLCGHNMKEFDMPYISRRMVVNQLPMPNAVNVTGKKPWETKNFLDTLTLWKFGDYKAYTSLKLLMGLFGLPSPKDDIDGSEVGRVYWEENDLDRIARYCEKDVLAVVQLLLKYMRMAPLEGEQIVVVD
ncbi:MAG: ribonuclease H-like domain-containing protein [Saprospiraceae bacterium]